MASDRRKALPAVVFEGGGVTVDKLPESLPESPIEREGVTGVTPSLRLPQNPPLNSTYIRSLNRASHPSHPAPFSFSGPIPAEEPMMPRNPLHTPPSELTVDQIGELAGPSSAFDGIPESVRDLERFTTMDGRNLDQIAFKRRHPSNLQLVSVESMTKWLTAHRGLSREQALLSIQAGAVRFLNGEERELMTTYDDPAMRVARLALAAAGGESESNRKVAAARLRLKAIEWRVLAAAADGNQAKKFEDAAVRRERAAVLVEDDAR